MTIFVTGAGGFIGSHVVEQLLATGNTVRALVHYNGVGRRGFLDESNVKSRSRLEIVAGDVRDAHQMSRLVQGCEAVLHLAALIAIPYSYQAADSYVATNVQGTLNILEACRSHKVRRVVVTSTSEVYGTAQHVPMTEFHPLQAQSPYAASKSARINWRCHTTEVTDFLLSLCVPSIPTDHASRPGRYCQPFSPKSFRAEKRFRWEV